MKVDIILSGGGLAGIVAGIALKQAGFAVAVIDLKDPQSTLDASFDGRTTALSLGSQRMFESLGIWSELSEQAQPIFSIRVYEHNSPWSLTYDYRDVGVDPLGYIISNTALRCGLFRAFQQTEGLLLFAPAKANVIERSLKGVKVILEDGRELESSLIVACEGRNSLLRDQAGINVTRWDYPQRALVCTVAHEKPHFGRAWEVFTPGGPLAALPLPICPLTGWDRSGIVWSDASPQVDRLLGLTDLELVAVFEETFPFLGKIGLPTKRSDYPLSGHRVDRLIDERLAVIGDAAHLIHPVAGQGVNLGWRDAIALRDTLGTARKQGLDIGSAQVLEGYQRSRRKDQWTVMSLCHGMVKLFSNESSTLHFLRNAGFGIVNELSPLKRRLIRQASK